MRIWLVLMFALLGGLARAEKILLVPLDSRPAAGQFAQMIGRVGGAEIIEPPYETLGRFTSPGSPEAILSWLEDYDYKDVGSVIVSTDMIAYGGLIASRTLDTSYDVALQRIKRLEALRNAHKDVRFYGFSAIMRLYPTATKATARWRLSLGQYAQLRERYQRLGTTSVLTSLKAIEAKIPPMEVAKYEATRSRDLMIQEALLRLTSRGLFDYIILGQDDAQPFGPHVPETNHLRVVVDHLMIGGKVYFCEGIDQHSNVLVSRALLHDGGWVPRVRVVYSDPAGRLRVPDYESKNLEQSLRDQIFASGARPATDENFDYTLYLNTPKRSEDKFQVFLGELNEDADKGQPVGVADVDLAKDGTADPELFQSLLQNGRMFKLLAYAGWNTAGNTMGTAIPAANVYLLAKKSNADPLGREVAQREFLLHRLVNDYSYHKFTRPLAYHLIDSMPGASREESYGDDFKQINGFVRRDLERHLQDTFKEEFLGKHFLAGGKEYEVSGLDEIKIFLPWPRVYEVRLEFKLETHEVALTQANAGPGK
jgi:hypothetical protein